MKKLFMLLMLGSFVAFAPACKKKPKDEDIKAAIEKVVASGVGVSVEKGVATLTGQVADDAAKAAAEAAVKAVAGVVSVANNLSVTPVTINVDSTLIKTVGEVIAKFKGTNADVKEGVVTLTGEIKKTDLPALMSAIMALKPKSVDNKLTVK